MSRMESEFLSTLDNLLLILFPFIRGGVTAGGGDRMTGDSIALLSAALSGVMQVGSECRVQGWH